MSQDNEPLDDENDTTVILEDEDGNEVEFDAIDLVNGGGQDYVILEPKLEPPEEEKEAIYRALLQEGMADDEARATAYEGERLLPMRLDTVDGEETLFHVQDEAEFLGVLAAYDAANG